MLGWPRSFNICTFGNDFLASVLLLLLLLLLFWLRLVLLCLRLLLRLLRPSLYTPHAPALGLAPAPGPAPAAHCFHLLWTTMFNLAVRHGSPRELLGVLAGK